MIKALGNWDLKWIELQVLLNNLAPRYLCKICVETLI